MKITLLVPVINELAGVQAIMPKIRREWVDEILVVDGHSTDGTREYCEQHGYRVIVQQRPGSMGAWWEGFQAAKGDVIILFSPDGNSVPEAIPQLVEAMRNGCDMVIASRYKDDAKSDDDDVFSAAGNTFFNKLINLLFTARYTDALVMYRAFKKDLLDRLHFTEATGSQLNRYHVSIFELIVSIRCAQRKFKVEEIASDEPDNIGREDSRAHPGMTKFYNGGLMFYHVVREFLLRPGL